MLFVNFVVVHFTTSNLNFVNRVLGKSDKVGQLCCWILKKSSTFSLSLSWIIINLYNDNFPRSKTFSLITSFNTKENKKKHKSIHHWDFRFFLFFSLTFVLIWIVFFLLFFCLYLLAFFIHCESLFHCTLYIFFFFLLSKRTTATKKRKIYNFSRNKNFFFGFSWKDFYSLIYS